MKLDDLQNYAPITEYSYNKLMNAARSVGEEPLGKRKIHAVVIAAALVMLIAATALALANRARLLDFFAIWKENGIPQTPTAFIREIPESEILTLAEYDDLVVMVEEAVSSGDQFYINTTIELKPGVPGRLVNVDMQGEDMMELALNADVPVYFVRSYIMHEDNISDSGDGMSNEDGSISSLSVVRLVEAADIANMKCYVSYVKSEPGVLPNESDVHTTYIPFSLKMQDPIEAQVVVNTATIDDLCITIDELFFKKAPGGTYCFSYISYAGGEPVDYKLPYGNHGLTLRVLDGDGVEVLIPRLSCNWVSEAYFTGFNALDIEDLPNRVIVEVFDENSNTIYGSTAIELQPGHLDTARLDAYRINPYEMVDLRDMYFPWSDMGFVSEYAYLSEDVIGGVPLYLDPRDDSTIVGIYNGGLKVIPNITYGAWTSIYFGDRNNTGTKGYVMSIHLSESTEENHSDLAVAYIQGPADELIDVKISPSVTSAAKTSVASQDKVFIIGKTDNWCHIAREEAGMVRVIGYVPIDTLSFVDD